MAVVLTFVCRSGDKIGKVIGLVIYTARHVLSSKTMPCY